MVSSNNRSCSDPFGDSLVDHHAWRRLSPAGAVVLLALSSLNSDAPRPPHFFVPPSDLSSVIPNPLDTIIIVKNRLLSASSEPLSKFPGPSRRILSAHGYVSLKFRDSGIMPNETLSSLDTILEEAPRWIQELERISESAIKRQLELISAHQVVEQDVTSSTRESLAGFTHPFMASEEPTVIAGQATDDTQPLMVRMTDSDALRLSQRKRKTASVCSGDVSGPSKLRVRSRAIVYFDSDAQLSIEQMFRAISTARNGIRKGKMSARVDSLSRLGSSSSEASESDGEDAWASSSKLALASARLPRSRLSAPDDGAETFDKIDASLNEAQNLCERAAHQMLRSGTCSLEISKAKVHLIQAIHDVKAGLPAMRQRVAKAETRKQRREGRQQVVTEANSAQSCEDNGVEVNSRDEPILVVFPTETKLEVDNIEVGDDSDDDGDGHFDAIPLGKFAQLPRARRTAC